jgi:DNA-binding winged helix-turn-helix (wHTH) protein
MIVFSPFRLDPNNEQLWRGREQVALKPKAFALLRYLVERPQCLITKAELLDHFWSDVHVGDAVLKTHLAEIRRALGDDTKSPRFIETAHRRGYRFIARLEASSPAASAALPEPALTSSSAAAVSVSSAPARRRASFVGRELELRRLDACLSRALEGPLQAVFLSGEAGAGKTTLAGEFLAHLEQRGGLLLARGQCIEQYGASEAYLPVLEALGRLCRQSGKERIIEVLRRQAPSWLIQLSGVIEAAEHAALAATASATPERMLREIAEAVLTLSEERGLVLLFEDLHWADPSTLNLISYLARRSDPARVLVLGTYRPHDLRQQQHALVSVQQDLQVSGRGEEIALAQLSERALSEYLEARFAGHQFPAQLAQQLGERTSGNPLFLARLVDYWLEREWLVQRDGVWQLGVEAAQLVRGVPKSLSRMIEREIAAQPEFERSVIEVASVAGVEFSVPTVAAALEVDVARTEELCHAWARRGQFLRRLGTSEGPDGRISLRCAFAHGLYQQVAYEGIAPARLAQLHLRVGAQLEASHVGSVELVASELALHFERGRAYSSALRYLMLAAERALSRSAYREALQHAQQGLRLLPQLPSEERPACELQLELMQGATLAMTRGFAASEAERSYARCKELCATLGERSALLPAVLEGIWKFYLVRGSMPIAAELEQQISALAEEQRDPTFRVAARAIRAITYCYLGRFPEARSVAEAVLPELDAYCANLRLTLYSEDPRVLVGGHLPWALWTVGYPDRALAAVERVVAFARQSAHPFSLVCALYYRAASFWIQKDFPRALGACDEVLQVAADYEFPLFTAMSDMLRGGALVSLGQTRAGLDVLESAWKVYRATGTGVGNIHNILAQALAADGRFDEALAVLKEGFEHGERAGYHAWDIWLYHCRGEIAVRMSREGQCELASAERDFTLALEMSRASGARSPELRVSVSLARLWHSQGKSAQAHALLAPVYASFDEGWGTLDLRDAAQLLSELAASE